MPDILGLDRYMHEAYRILVRERQCTAARVAAHLGISRPDAEETLRRLETVGLAAQCGDDPRQLVPVDPQHTLGAALAKRQAKLLAEQQEVSKVRDAVSALASLFAAHNGDGRTGKSEVSHGTDAVRARVEGLVAAATSTIVGVVDEGASSIAFGLRPEVIETSIARGVAVRVLYPRTAAADPRFVTQSRWLVGAGGRVRAGRCLPPPMIIVDGSTTLLPADGTSATALVVHNRSLGRAMSALFEQVWTESRVATTPPATADVSEPSAAEIDLLRLLGKGMTDASAARQLGVSLRTVRRMMADLMSRLGARSRFEAGMRASERGWVAPGTTTTTLQLSRPDVRQQQVKVG